MKKWLTETKAKIGKAIDEWLETPEEKQARLDIEEARVKYRAEQRRLEKARENEAYQKVMTEYRSEPGPLPMSELFEHYKAKGLTGPGKLCEILEDELQYLLLEEEAFEWETKSPQPDVGFALGSTRKTGVTATVKTPGAPLEDLRAVRVMSSDGEILEGDTILRGEVKFGDHWVNHVYLSRPWTDYKTVIGREMPVFYKSRPWRICMFLGVEEFRDEIPFERDMFGPDPDARKAKWGRWLIGEQVWVGWIHPDAMREFKKPEEE